MKSSGQQNTGHFSLGTNGFLTIEQWCALIAEPQLKTLRFRSTPKTYPLVEAFSQTDQHLGLMQWVDFDIGLDNSANHNDISQDMIAMLDWLSAATQTDWILSASKAPNGAQRNQLSRTLRDGPTVKDLEAIDWQTVLAALPGGIRWMGILNITPDSFSDGGKNNSLEQLYQSVEQQLKAGVAILDLGGQSTRPGATSLSAGEEWQRLEPALKQTLKQIKAWPFPVQISVDTYHAKIAEKAIELGAHIINDVSGLTRQAMRSVFQNYPKTQWIIMHQLTIPADKNITLAPTDDVLGILNTWVADTQQRLTALNPDYNAEQIIFDPGLGFGKNPAQNQLIIRAFKQLDPDVKWLIAHSRKSFLNHLLVGENDQQITSQRDAGTHGSSIVLALNGCKMLRVHHVADAATAVNAALAATPAMAINEIQ